MECEDGVGVAVVVVVAVRCLGMEGRRVVFPVMIVLGVLKVSPDVVINVNPVHSSSDVAFGSYWWQCWWWLSLTGIRKRTSFVRVEIV